MTIHASVKEPAEPDELLRLFADPLRARLVSLLAVEQLCTCHLAELTGALLVERQAAGRFTYYRLRAEVLDDLGEHLTGLAASARSAPRRPC